MDSFKMIIADENMIRRGVLFMLWIDYLWEQYLSFRQLKKASATTVVPTELKAVMPQKTFDKARQCMLERRYFGFIEDLVAIIISTTIIQSNLLPVLWNISTSINTFGSEVLTNCIWYAILSTSLAFLNLPLTIYETFAMDQQYGIDEKRAREFLIWERIKTFVFAQICAIMMSSIVVMTIRKGGVDLLTWCWLVFCLVVFIVGVAYPMMAPSLFHSHTPLAECELRTQIQNLASQLKFPLKQLYIEERDMRSCRRHIYFYGSLNSKRIVLFDALFPKGDGSGCNNQEILALISQELGHWHHSHGFKYVVLLEVNLILSFASFVFAFTYPPIYKAFGFHGRQPILPGLYIVLKYVLVSCSNILNLLFTYFSRSFEFQADLFAADLGKSKELVSALVQMDKDNVSFPVYDRLYSVRHNVEPPLLERIDAIREAADGKFK